MRKFLGGIKRKLALSPQPNQFFELVVSLVEKQEFSTLKRVSEEHHHYAVDDVHVCIEYFEPDCFAEMQISLGYELGRGVTVVIRNYSEHLVVINHEILGQYYTIEHCIPAASIMFKSYRERLDAIAHAVINSVREIDNA